jgi:hypothetical protein
MIVLEAFSQMICNPVGPTVTFSYQDYLLHWSSRRIDVFQNLIEVEIAPFFFCVWLACFDKPASVRELLRLQVRCVLGNAQSEHRVLENAQSEHCKQDDAWNGFNATST